MIGLESSVVASPSLYSVDSDSVRVTATRSGDTSTTYNVSAGWESSSTPDVKPTPSAPGLAVGEAEIGALVADDGSYWRSASATVDQQWNWQLMRVDLGEDARDTIKELGIVWNGHGEPTPGYPTALYVWNPQAESWMDIRSLDMPTDQDVKYAVNTSGSAFCLTCHDNEPPQGVAALDGVTDIEAEWLDANGDFHGKRTGDGFGTTDVKAPYSRADASGIACVVCHDAHGTESLYHVPTAVNGRQGVVVRSGADFDELCASCHEGQIDQWHAVCVTCHTQGHWVDSMAGVVEGMLPTAASDYSQCHGHGRSWTHPATCLRCHNEIELRIYGVSPDDPWTYTSTF